MFLKSSPVKRCLIQMCTGEDSHGLLSTGSTVWNEKTSVVWNRHIYISMDTSQKCAVYSLHLKITLTLTKKKKRRYILHVLKEDKEEFSSSFKNLKTNSFVNNVTDMKHSHELWRQQRSARRSQHHPHGWLAFSPRCVLTPSSTGNPGTHP